MARSTNGCDTAASVQSKTRAPSAPKTTFHGWKSPWTSVGPGPSSSRRRQDSARVGAVASQLARTSADIRSSSTVSSVISSTCVARSLNDRTGSPRPTSSAVRPSHRRWMPATATQALVPQRLVLVTQLDGTEVTHQHPSLGTVDGDHLRHKGRHPLCQRLGRGGLVPEDLRTALEEGVTVLRRGAQDDRHVPELVLPRCADSRAAVLRHLLDHPGGGPREPSRARPRGPQRRPSLDPLPRPRGHGRPRRLRLQPREHVRIEVLPDPAGRGIGACGLELHHQRDLTALDRIAVFRVTG